MPSQTQASNDQIIHLRIGSVWNFQKHFEISKNKIHIIIRSRTTLVPHFWRSSFLSQHLLHWVYNYKSYRRMEKIIPCCELTHGSLINCIHISRLVDVDSPTNLSTYFFILSKSFLKYTSKCVRDHFPSSQEFY